MVPAVQLTTSLLPHICSPDSLDGQMSPKIYLTTFLFVSSSPYHSVRLQVVFRVGHNTSHTAFILREAIQSLRDHSKEAYVAFLDVKKALTQCGIRVCLSRCTGKGTLPPLD